MVLRFMHLGGPLMWLLLGCSVLLIAVLIDRAYVIGIKSRVLGRRLDPAQVTWHRRVLPFFADVPPSIGLLGTVVGVVRSFELIDGRLNTTAVGAGLGIACTTTIFGLGIAIVASVGGHLLDWAVAQSGRMTAEGVVDGAAPC